MYFINFWQFIRKIRISIQNPQNTTNPQICHFWGFNPQGWAPWVWCILRHMAHPQAEWISCCTVYAFLMPMHVRATCHAPHSHRAVHQHMAYLVAEIEPQVSRLWLWMGACCCVTAMLAGVPCLARVSTSAKDTWSSSSLADMDLTSSSRLAILASNFLYVVLPSPSSYSDFTPTLLAWVVILSQEDCTASTMTGFNWAGTACATSAIDLEPPDPSFSPSSVMDIPIPWSSVSLK